MERRPDPELRRLFVPDGPPADPPPAEHWLDRARLFNQVALGWALALLGIGLNAAWALAGHGTPFVAGCVLGVIAMASAWLAETAGLFRRSAFQTVFHAMCIGSTAASLILWAALVIPPAGAADLPRHVGVVDGDTFDARFRLAGIDTPELHSPGCPAERETAARAAAFTRVWLAERAERLSIEVTDVGRYGRLIARVRSGEEDLGDALLAAGLAVTWPHRGNPWCGR